MSIKTISIIIKTISKGNQPLLTKPTSSKTSNGENTEDTSLLSRLNKNYLNFEVEKLILDSWASRTRKQCKIYFKQWTTFCKT